MNHHRHFLHWLFDTAIQTEYDDDAFSRGVEDRAGGGGGCWTWTDEMEGDSRKRKGSGGLNKGATARTGGGGGGGGVLTRSDAFRAYVIRTLPSPSLLFAKLRTAVRGAIRRSVVHRSHI